MQINLRVNGATTDRVWIVGVTVQAYGVRADCSIIIADVDKSGRDMAESLCVSIFCYSLQECAKSVGLDVTMTEVFRRHKPIPWPKQIRHRVIINDKPDGDFVLINFHVRLCPFSAVLLCLDRFVDAS